MARSTLQNKNYSRNLAILQAIKTKEILNKAENLRKLPYQADDAFRFLFEQGISNRRKSIDILLNGKLGKRFNTFTRFLFDTSGEYKYLLSDPNARYFVAELFLLGTVIDDTLESTDLQGIEWVQSKSKDDHNLYLRVAPNTSHAAIKSFVSLAQNQPQTVFNKLKGIPYTELNLTPKDTDAERMRIIVNNLNKLSPRALENIFLAMYGKEFKDRFFFSNGKRKPNSRRKYDYIAYHLKHGYDIHTDKGDLYSDGYIRSLLAKKPTK